MLSIIMLSVLMSKAIMLSVIILDAVNSNVVAPEKKMEDARFFCYKGETKYCTVVQACRLPQQVSLFWKEKKKLQSSFFSKRFVTIFLFKV
jgi:hypothetical protein